MLQLAGRQKVHWPVEGCPPARYRYLPHRFRLAAHRRVAKRDPRLLGGRSRRDGRIMMNPSRDPRALSLRATGEDAIASGAVWRACAPFRTSLQSRFKRRRPEHYSLGLRNAVRVQLDLPRFFHIFSTFFARFLSRSCFYKTSSIKKY